MHVSPIIIVKEIHNMLFLLSAVTKGILRHKTNAMKPGIPSSKKVSMY
jgi:hypothetical protein